MFILILLAGCAQEPATVAPTSTKPPLPTPARQATDTPTQTPRATATPLPSATPPPPAPDLPIFEPTECRFRASTRPGLECGDLLVLENRDDPDSPVLRLHVAVFRSQAEAPEPDPLIYLSGGPGSIALEWLRWQSDEYQQILEGRDVIFFDQRGIGYSEPDMDCPEVLEDHERVLQQDLPVDEWVPSRVEAHLACRSG